MIKTSVLSAVLFFSMSACLPESLFAGNHGYIMRAPVHKIYRVVVDAGHGGKDPGTVSADGVQEKDLTLQFAKALKEELEKEKIEVLLTRDSDVYIPLSERSRLANVKKADFFVSVHVNASESDSLSGFEVYYLSEAVDDVSLAAERAENSPFERHESAQVLEATTALKTMYWDLKETANRKESIQMAGFVADAVEKAVPIAAKRVKFAKFYVLKRSECPAVLVETGYLSNEEDHKKLLDPDYQKKMIHGIAQGILSYKQLFEATNGFTREKK